jgi:Ran GTPase-activating protein (RanGAP) involved in mRNA processing and transport
VKALELLDNKITHLGCEFLGNLMHPKSNGSIQILKLDHNDIGADGLKTLTNGLAINKTLTSLSLTYCNITAAGARPIFEILIYT